MQKFFEHFNHHPGKDGWSILQSKRHYYILVESPFYGKRGLVAFLLINSDLMVS